MPPSEKTCVSCGRRIEWRKKWARDWDSVRYCSTACRRRGISATDRAVEKAVRDLLGTSASGRLVDPEDAARSVSSTEASTISPELTEAARRAARRLVAAGVAEIVQRGRVVDPSTAKGPIRVRRTR